MAAALDANVLLDGICQFIAPERRAWARLFSLTHHKKAFLDETQEDNIGIRILFGGRLNQDCATEVIKWLVE